MSTEPILAQREGPTLISVVAEIQPSTNSNSRVLAYASVTLHFQPAGALTIHGFTIIDSENKGDLAILPPSRKSGDRFFKTVLLSGRLRAIIEQAVLEEYGIYVEKPS